LNEQDLNGIADQLSALESTPDTSPSPSTTSDTPASLATPASGATPVSTPEDDVIEVTFKDGTKEAIKRSELPNAILRQRDYTHKTTQVAELRKKYEQLEQNAPRIREELEFAQQMRQATSDPAALFRYVVEQVGPQEALKLMTGHMGQNPGAYDPNDIPTYKEADDLIQSKFSTFEEKLAAQEQLFNERLEARVMQERQALEFERAKNEYASKFNSMIEKSFTDNPALKAIDLSEDILRYKVSQKIQNFQKLNGYEPTFEQAAQWLQDSVKEQVGKLETEFSGRQKNSPLNNGIEPPGGNRPVGVNTQQRSFYYEKTGELDSDAQLKEIAARIAGLNRL
jgi:hypothetical protein